jgi:tRNA(fMet)-specific endonuclease VapC
MEKSQLILLDTSILIDYLRKTKKESTFFVEISEQFASLAVSVVTKFEIYIGSNPTQQEFWDSVFENITVLPLTEACMDTAVEIQSKLKKDGNQIDFADLLIASTAKTHGLMLATLNIKHFNRIQDLPLHTPVREK